MPVKILVKILNVEYSAQTYLKRKQTGVGRKWTNTCKCRDFSTPSLIFFNLDWNNIFYHSKYSIGVFSVNPPNFWDREGTF